MGVPEIGPVLSTPDTHVFDDPAPVVDVRSLPRLSDEQLHSQYEIQRTIDEIRESRWKTIALQFPDDMLVDAPRVSEALYHGLENARKRRKISHGAPENDMDNTSKRELEEDMSKLDIASDEAAEKVYILADTSYGACCVDEIAAEHVDADVVIHYGRACLSPTTRLPVVYIYTSRPLDLGATKIAFMETHPKRDMKVVLMADIPYAHHISHLHGLLQEEGYKKLFTTSIIHDPSCLIPNRTIPEDADCDVDKLRSYSLFHISDPPTALLLTLSSRFESIHIYPTTASSSFSASSSTPTLSETRPQALAPASTMPLIRRRYAMLRTLTTASIIGILISTLSVRSYLPAVQRIQRLISGAGKKYYTVVVGKVNPAKVANFAEIEAWVVVSCWESGLVDMKGGEGYWRPMVTPFELEMALSDEAGRIWMGEWKGGFDGVGEGRDKIPDGIGTEEEGHQAAQDPSRGNEIGNSDSEEESAPPEFDIRTGKYISNTRPMGTSSGPTSRKQTKLENGPPVNVLVRRANGDVARIGGEASPGAEFLRTKRTWQGLGSDFEIGYQEDGATVEEGRKGIARGYSTGDGRVRT